MVYRIDLTEEEYDLLQRLIIASKKDRSMNKDRILEQFEIKVGMTLPEKVEIVKK
jgi:hypothetical protein